MCLDVGKRCLDSDLSIQGLELGFESRFSECFVEHAIVKDEVNSGELLSAIVHRKTSTHDPHKGIFVIVTSQNQSFIKGIQ